MRRRQVTSVLAVWLVLCAVALGANDIIDATARVLGPDGKPAGTAVVVGNDGQTLILATCGHVVREGHPGNGPPHRAMQVEFWRDGHKSTPFPATVTAAGVIGDVDVGLLAVPASMFGSSPPPQVPLAPKGFRLQPGQTIMSVGCAKGAWATTFRGHVVRMSAEEAATVASGTFAITPGPAHGRSGSGVFALYHGRHVLVGILYAQSKILPRGYVTSIDTIRQRWGVVRRTGIVPVQCNDRNCRNCQRGGLVPGLYQQFFGSRQQQPQREQPRTYELPPQGNPFPGTPSWGGGEAPPYVPPVQPPAPPGYYWDRTTGELVRQPVITPGPIPPADLDLRVEVDGLADLSAALKLHVEALAADAKELRDERKAAAAVVKGEQLAEQGTAIIPTVLGTGKLLVKGEFREAGRVAAKSDTLWSLIGKGFATLAVALGVPAFIAVGGSQVAANFIRGRLRGPKHTVFDDIANNIADRTEKKINGSLATRTGKKT